MPERPNIFTSPYEQDPEDPPGYRGATLRVSRLAGGRELSIKAFELPPGENLCPYHYEYVEEWLILLEGTLAVRVPGGEERLARGEFMCFPAGPAGAHKLTNPGSETARLLMFSSAHEPSVAVYPDSDKIGVWLPGGADNLMVRRADGDVDYYDGET